MSYISSIDPDLINEISEKFLDKLFQEYFRGQLHNIEKVRFKDDRPVIFVLNHSGMSYPWDGFIFTFLANGMFQKYLRVNVSKQTLNLSILSPKNMFRRLGGIENNLEVIEQTLKLEKYLIIFPEGTAGISKGFNCRYQLQKYHKSFIHLAIKHKAHLVPVNVVNGEYLLPFMYGSEFINKISRFFGLAFLPFGLFSFLFIFPAFVYFALPSKITYVIHDSVEIPFDENSITSERQFISEATLSFQKKQQELLDADVKKYHVPYAWKEFFNSFIKSKNKKIFFPFFWHEYLCDILKLDWYIKLFYKLPIVGWLLLLIFLPKNKPMN